MNLKEALGLFPRTKRRQWANLVYVTVDGGEIVFFNGRFRKTINLDEPPVELQHDDYVGLGKPHRDPGLK